MKNVRIWFKKDKECRFISHLDLNRVMLRTVFRAKLPIWYTEGFNPHPFITFPLPLSLGVRGEAECMDVRFLDEDFDLSKVAEIMNPFLPDGIRVYDATECKMKPGDIAFAKFTAKIYSDAMSVDELKTQLCQLMKLDEYLVPKKTKSGIKDVNISEYLKLIEILPGCDALNISVTLPAGSANNVNVQLLIKALESYVASDVYYDITRLGVFNKEMKPFE
ncbi:MAG: DUF2344 domain-containing protein [Ruminococcus sp.]|nr:DUF2344 domain-containing protein [Ruminococcus sp.]MBQ8571933.1 DUF2344 domain-containing protein [Ruminococcus sp.]